MSRRRVRVPATVWSQLGPVPVRLTTPVLGDDGEPLCGSYDADARVIEVDSTMAPVVQMQRAYHEAVHAWLLDAGLRLGKMEEPVVDVIATAIVNVLQGRR